MPEADHSSQRIGRSLSALLLFALCCSGATRVYEGPPRPPAEVVRLELDPTGIRISAIDGREIRSGSRFDLLPGLHQVDFEIRTAATGNLGVAQAPRFQIDCSLDFMGEAGRSYRIDLDLSRRITDSELEILVQALLTESGGDGSAETVCIGVGKAQRIRIPVYLPEPMT